MDLVKLQFNGYLEDAKMDNMNVYIDVLRISFTTRNNEGRHQNYLFRTNSLAKDCQMGFGFCCITILDQA